MQITLVQNAPTLSKIKNIQLIKKEISNHKKSNLLIFPELSLNGYGLKDSVFDSYFSQDEILQLFQGVKPDIVLSCAFLDNGTIFNSALYISNGKILHIHHKNNLPNYTFFQEARFFSRGKKISSFDTSFGKVAIVICEDLWNAKVIHKLCKQNLDIVIILSASPSRGFGDNLEIKEQWDSILKTTSLLSKAHCLFVNRVGFEDGLGFWGGSKVVLPDSNILTECKLFEEDFLTFTIDKNNNLFQTYMRGLK